MAISKASWVVFLVILMIIKANSAPSVPSSLTKQVKNFLEEILGLALNGVEAWKEAHPGVSKVYDNDCSRKFNNSIANLNSSVIDILNGTAAEPPKNVTAYIENWVDEAEKNETSCLAAGLNSPASTAGLSAFSYALCSLFYFGFLLAVLPVFFVRS